MNTRLSQFINYATGGNRAEFARICGWTPQYVYNLTKMNNFGITPVLTLLDKFPELSARWLLLGEGEMLTPQIDALKQHLLRLLELDRYLCVMTTEEQQQVIAGNLDFDEPTFDKWRTLLAARNAERDARFAEAYARQKTLKKK